MQSLEQIVSLVISFLGGGVAVAFINLWNTNRLERKRKQIEFIRLQLQELYGPLQFFTSCNEQLFKLVDKIHKAYTDEYINKKWSDEPLT